MLGHQYHEQFTIGSLYIQVSAVSMIIFACSGLDAAAPTMGAGNQDAHLTVPQGEERESQFCMSGQDIPRKNNRNIMILPCAGRFSLEKAEGVPGSSPCRPPEAPRCPRRGRSAASAAAAAPAGTVSVTPPCSRVSAPPALPAQQKIASFHFSQAYGDGNIRSAIAEFLAKEEHLL